MCPRRVTIAVLAVMVACSDSRPAPAAHRADAGRPSADAAAPFRSSFIEAPTQIPECDAYLVLLERVMACPTTPTELRDVLRQAIEMLVPMLGDPDRLGIDRAGIAAQCSQFSRSMSFDGQPWVCAP